MINEEKIRLMTRLTVYEEGRGVGDKKTAAYFRNDYVFAGMLGSFITGTLAWGICAALYCGYFFEQIFFSVYEDSLEPVLRFAGMSYAAFIAFFLLVSFVIYSLRSMAFTDRRRMYLQDLNALADICRKESEEAASAESFTEAE